LAVRHSLLAEKALLSLKVCDPACGSGHFLTAAARRIADALARRRAGGDEPSPEQRRHALRDVVGKCIYGIDLNLMAVELCKVALWMDALEPGKPLSFLDNRIRWGNSLLGTTPELLEKGIPDEAFAPIEGDDKKVCAGLKKENKAQRAGQSTLALFDEPWSLDLGDLRASIQRLEAVSDNDIAGVREKERMLQAFEKSEAYLYITTLSNFRFFRLQLMIQRVSGNHKLLWMTGFRCVCWNLLTPCTIWNRSRAT
jgi:hypothetical protein